MMRTSQEQRQALEAACEGPLDDLASVEALCDLLEVEQDFPALEALLERAVRRWPDAADFVLRRGRMRMFLGRGEEAYGDFEAALELDPDNVMAIVTLVRRGQGARIGGLARIDAALGAAIPDSPEATRLTYARGLLLEAQGHYEEAFDAFRNASCADARARGVDVQALLRAARSVLRDIRPEIVNTVRGEGHDSDKPVFIVGMPRSGTTLTEQFISAHPSVYAAGEHMAWSAVLNRLVRSVNPLGQSMIEAIDEFDSQLWEKAGGSYLAAFDEEALGHAHITNKLPANFNLLPFIRLVFPRARILHLRREPRAVLCSCIRQDFGADQLALSAEDWARFYGLYEALMANWTPILGTQMLTLEYEELVQDFPRQARRVIDFLGLDWDDACLRPEANARAVTTASVQQVREPVHAAAVDAWRRYEAQLNPLLDLARETRRDLLEG